MTFQKKITYLGMSLLVLFLVACAPQIPAVPVTGNTSVPSTPTVFLELPPEAVLDAQEWLATEISAAVEQVQIIEVEQAEWTDSCLGLGRLNESCLQAITPGWRVIFEVNGQRYEVRTDESGSTIRLNSPEGTPGAGVTLENTPWSLVSFGTPEAGTPLVEGSAIALILADGRAGGMGGCNSYGGTYQIEADTVSFDQLTRTEIACADERVTEQEQRYFNALESAGRYELDGNLLRIWYDDGAGVLVFETLLPGGPIPAVETPGG
jgi:heat shock protein HslJ